MNVKTSIRIATSAFDPEAESNDFRAATEDAGAIVSFLGQVRHDKGEVESLTIEHYPGFTEESVEGFAKEAAEHWRLQAIRIVHRVGELHPGEPIVFVATASAHRRDAFEAADFLMDHLKTDAPFWKNERSGGKSHWIEPRIEDHHDRERWRVHRKDKVMNVRH
jgi:molybdopterin synthase catalytic subunit